MKKTMLLGMVLLTMVIGITGCGSKAEAEAEAVIVHISDEQIVREYLAEEHGIQADNIEITYNEELDRYDDNGIQRFGEDFRDYIAYDKDGNVVALGSVDLSWAAYIYCN